MMVTADIPLMSGGFGGGRDSMEQLAAQLTAKLGLTDFLKRVVDELKIELTPAAYLMLLVPLAEINRQAKSEVKKWNFSHQEERLAIDRAPVEESLLKLLTEMAQSPAAADRNIKREDTNRGSWLDRFRFTEAYPLRTSLSAIKAYWKRFCNIPPLCGETKE
jgi:hypothetical protein